MIAEAKIVNFYKNSLKKFADKKILPTFALAITKCVVDGAIAQLVEQRTENPCVPGSIPGGTTQKADSLLSLLFLLALCHNYMTDKLLVDVMTGNQRILSHPAYFSLSKSFSLFWLMILIRACLL